MSERLSRIDPPECGCTPCICGGSEPFRTYGDVDQFRGLLHGELIDATGDRDERGAWMHTALRECPQKLAEFLAEEFMAGRLISKYVLQAKVSGLVLGALVDDD